jgi:hypothetical protein
MKLIDIPKYLDLIEYENLTTAIINKYSGFEEITAICKIGTVSAPGISDLDFLFIFENESSFRHDILNELTGSQRYIMIHNPFGIPEKYLDTQLKKIFFGYFSLLYSKNDFQHNINTNWEIPESVRRQNALEYLVKFFITLSVQLSLNTLKVRSLLLELHALKFDFEELGNMSHELHDSFNILLELRRDWFNIHQRNEIFIKYIKTFHTLLAEYLNNILDKYLICLPFVNDFNLANNIKLINKSPLNFYVNGIGKRISFLNLNSRKIFNLAGKLTNFIFYVPWLNLEKAEPAVREKLREEMNIVIYNRNFLPGFLALRSSFNFI